MNKEELLNKLDISQKELLAVNSYNLLHNPSRELELRRQSLLADYEILKTHIDQHPCLISKLGLKIVLWLSKNTVKRTIREHPDFEQFFKDNTGMEVRR